MKARPQGIALSRIAALESNNAFRLAVYRRWISREQYDRVWALFKVDVENGFLRPAPFPLDEIFAEAERLSAAHTARTGTRSLDVLHIACARISELELFASFDEGQRTLAAEAGLRVVPE